MSLHVSLRHVTQYRYDRSIELGAQVVRLRPAAHCRTPIVSYSFNVTPGEHFLNWQQDPHGNYLARLVFPEKTTSFKVEVDLVVELVALNPFDFFLEPPADHFPFEYEAALAADLAPYLRQSESGQKLSAWVASVVDNLPKKPEPTMDFITDLNRRLAGEIDYVVRLEPGVQTPEQTLELARGSCRDSGWLLVQILRRLGIAARFVSGYLIQLTADQESLDGPSGPAEDFCDLHAWAEAYVPGAGWIGLDATSGLLAGEGHLPLACTPEPRSAAPITGTLEDCKVEFDVTMQVERIVESARVTKPYTEAEWSAINALGESVDARLRDGDVRLTVGGEPTFVSLDDQHGDEWSTAAVGPTKTVLAADLVARLRDRYAPGGVLQFGQGKWYPGEPLPRWSYGLFWRNDDQPLWASPELVALKPGESATMDEAKSFARTLCHQLGVDHDHAMPLYEDPWVVRTGDAADGDKDGNKAQAARGKLGPPVAIVLPVQPWQARATQSGLGSVPSTRRRWRSERWELRTEHLFLAPGDSPAGLRLPLDSLPPVAPGDAFSTLPVVPFDPAPPLPKPAQLQVPCPPSRPGDGAPQTRNVRTALTLEPRDGFLYVFLPPLPEAEDYVALLGAVEATAKERAVPVRLEGYEPPNDPRMRSVRVTPDPGVIEVNVAPSSSWTELVSSTEALYEEARLARLTTEKFLLDGQHVGTGGGNHVVLGGKNPADSPFLRRPDMLKSLVGYFINHPSLSFLFSGLFIGPTSQAPRIDQARDDALYELELAFAQIPSPVAGAEPPVPWQVDRIFRDLLVDVTGNTHRTEICIDKLYSPDSATGRLGLVELRSFEMPPHARMSLAQALLVRALVARFWEQPYEQPLIHWGTQLHDRFLLPHFVWQDLVDVTDDLAACDIAVDPRWFLPHYEFRFPRIGTLRYREIEIELRTALEPWHVTGEDGAPGGTARYVDSSLERVQVEARGMSGGRYVVCCNGRPVPLTPTGDAGRYVAGVRYRAWQPPRCLHPLLGVHAPLTFDLVDTWNNRSVSGCTYHVSHPGGRSHETFPVNALEAEGRRLGRFSTVARSGGAFTIEREKPNPAFPFTLDLRRPPAFA